jgi:hypothetical protein
VTISGVANGASYEFGNVPVACCNVVDKEDGNISFDASLSAVSGTRAAEGLGSQTASCNYDDAGGLNAKATATYSIVDTTKRSRCPTSPRKQPRTRSQTGSPTASLAADPDVPSVPSSMAAKCRRCSTLPAPRRWLTVYRSNDVGPGALSAAGIGW